MSQSFFDGGSKTMFFSGLFLGVACSALVGFALVFGMIWSGNGLALGAGAAAAPYVPSQPTQPSQPTAAAPTGTLKPIDSNDWVEGAKNAKVTMIEYSDFQCPYCERHEPSIQQALKDYPNDVRLVYRNYPLTSLHPEAQKGAEAAECAGKLGGQAKFWAMHDGMFADQTNLGRQMEINLAKKIGLNEANFTKCLDGGDTVALVQEDVNSGNDAGVQGTPATFVNGTLISGAVPYSDLKAAIDAALKK